MYEIEKNVPLSASQQGGIVYPFREMQPGDSFLVPAEKARADDKYMSSPRRAALIWGKRNNVKLVTRRVDGGLRIWRVA